MAPADRIGRLRDILRLHEPLPILPGRVDSKPLIRGFLETPCSCIVDMHELGLEFDPSDVCCVQDGGQFANRLFIERIDAEIDEDPREFHRYRDPNNNFRYKLYIDFIWQMGLMGQGRVPIPLCFTNAVREIWPSTSGEYIGFQP
jgi:hypothetical protein